jgi:drug/metabolite transporter (DMT)-like permease
MGEIAALFVAVCWGLSSIFFTSTSKQAGPTPVNRVRLLFAVPLLVITHTVLTGQVFPLQVEPYRWLWFSLSGIVGLVIGDTLLFTSYSLIGNRLGTLLMSCVPVISSLAAFLFLGEILDLRSIIGIFVCLSGVALVVMERRNRNGNGTSSISEKRLFWLGVLAGLGGATGQAGGLVLAKQGLVGDFPAISGTLIRMFAAMVFIWVITIGLGQTRQTLQKVFSSFKLASNIFGGSLVGPFIGVWLSQIAIQKTQVGIASTLMALTPVFLLPVAKWYYKEEVSRRAVFGTMIALVGVAIIFL